MNTQPLLTQQSAQSAASEETVIGTFTGRVQLITSHQVALAGLRLSLPQEASAMGLVPNELACLHATFSEASGQWRVLYASALVSKPQPAAMPVASSASIEPGLTPSSQLAQPASAQANTEQSLQGVTPTVAPAVSPAASPVVSSATTPAASPAPAPTQARAPGFMAPRMTSTPPVKPATSTANPSPTSVVPAQPARAAAPSIVLPKPGAPAAKQEKGFTFGVNPQSTLNAQSMDTASIPQGRNLNMNAIKKPIAPTGVRKPYAPSVVPQRAAQPAGKANVMPSAAPSTVRTPTPVSTVPAAPVAAVAPQIQKSGGFGMATQMVNPVDLPDPSLLPMDDCPFPTPSRGTLAGAERDKFLNKWALVDDDPSTDIPF